MAYHFDTYVFLENYCIDKNCDCRKVMIKAISKSVAFKLQFWYNFGECIHLNNIAMYVPREIEDAIHKKIFKKKVIIIYGARQVGKTTLVKDLLKKHPRQSIYLNCDELDIRDALTNKTSTEIKAFLGNNRLVVLDEAQRIVNIGLTLKLIVDNFPEIQVVATGSSSFEPLTGRKFEFHLYPLSYRELARYYPSALERRRHLERRIIYGMYPEAVLHAGEEEKEAVKNITRSYLYKDILAFQNIKSPEVLEKLLQALALQIGNEVSFSELSQIVGVDKNTIATYVQILEQAFIVHRLSPFSRNIRNELKKLRKIYFWDTGIRNALINNFNPLHVRQDTGALWENFLINERIKNNINHDKDCSRYFWRTHSQQELDYIEEYGGKLYAFEFKWKKQKWSPPSSFVEHYKRVPIEFIHSENFETFVTKI